MEQEIKKAKQRKNTGKPPRAVPIVLSLCLFAVIAALFILYRPAQQREDYKRISSENFDTVFLSMYPIETYDEADYAYYRAMTLFKASYEIPDYRTLCDYMKKIARSGNTVTTAYLGICPDKISSAQLSRLLELYPGVTFEVVLAYPSGSYWCSLSAEEYQTLINSYTEFLATLPMGSNRNFYLPGCQEWLIANPDNYESDLEVNTSVARTLMLRTDIGSDTLLTSENASVFSEKLAQLTDSLRTGPVSYPDLSDYCVIFFGDSVIANYTDSTSVPGVVHGLTKATVYNCGYGGNSAAMSADAPVSLPGIAESFCKGDLSALPEDTQAYQGLTSYLSNPPEGKKLCFVISYGLNDYFSGYPIAGEDSYDIFTYSGALRTALTTLQNAYPDAEIILCTPTYANIFDGGREPHGEAGSVLEDYVAAALSVAEEFGVTPLDNYYSLNITAENQGQYLLDQVHPNEAGRYLIGYRLAALLR